MAKILVVDDEDEFRLVVCNFLKANGHEILEAPNGRTGIALFQGAAIDLVLTDIVMPNINGLEMMRRLKQASIHAQFIAMTGGRGIESVRKLAALLGARYTFKKPLDLPNLLTAIHQVTHPPQPQQ